MILNGAQILIRELVSQGVTTVFGYPGGSVLPIYDELYKSTDKLTHVISAHEQGAVHAADGYARVSGKTGVVIATSGPGATNLVTGIANAYLDSVPLVAITGNVATPLLGRDSFQEVDIVGITQPIVKHSFIVRDVADLEKILKEAFIIANSNRLGPVLVDIPKSVQAAECEYCGESGPSPNCKVMRPENDISAAVAAIRAAKRPYIYAGGGIIASGAEAELLELSKRLSAPVGLSMMGLSALPYSYPLNLGMCGMHGKYAASKAQSECDLMLALGVRFSDRATGNVAEYTKKCTVIHADIDYAEHGKNVKDDIGLYGDVRQTLTELLKELPQYENKKWIEEIEHYKQVDSCYENDGFTPKNIIELVNSYCDPETIIATDVGQHQMWVMQYYHFEKTRKLLTSGGLGTMGYGLGAAIGGCMASGRKKTVLFTGDGSFGMNLNELATAVSQGLPIMIVVLNNGVLGMVRQWQNMFYNNHYSQTTLARKTDFPALAKAFGAESYSANNLQELNEILEKHTPADLPMLIDCRIDMDEKVLPMIPPGGSVKDIVIK